jgi:superfamily II DNA or RNA helicase
MLLENPNQQIMILAHNKSLLKYLYDAIAAREIATVGYYVGGMKEVALKASETKKVIIATYAMAAEGLDIKTLTTLIMATPKTDIEQSVGRILREKHSQPIVVDIIDTHEPFQKQWVKRRAFYRKQNYKIIHTTSVEYNADATSASWKDITGTLKKSVGCKGQGQAQDSSDEDVVGEEDETGPGKESNSMLQGKCFLLHKLKGATTKSPPPS